MGVEMESTWEPLEGLIQLTNCSNQFLNPPPALPVSTSGPYASLFGNHLMFHLMFLDCFLVYHFVVMSECKIR